MVKYICSDLQNREKRRLLYVKIQKGVQDEIKKVGNNDFSVQFPGIFR